MKWIKKDKEEPKALVDWRKQETETGNINWKADGDAIFSKLQNEPKRRDEGIFYYTKDELWAHLLKEQGGLCAYCGGKITKTQVRIEHLCPKSVHRNKTLSYHNLVAVCQGGLGNANTHCDVKKENKPIFIFPIHKICEESYTYEVNGLIEGINENKAANDTIDVLNLNVPKLVEKRKNIAEVIDVTFQEGIENLSREDQIIEIENEINDLYNQVDLEAYCFVKIYRLRLMLLPPVKKQQNTEGAYLK